MRIISVPCFSLFQRPDREAAYESASASLTSRARARSSVGTARPVANRMASMAASISSLPFAPPASPGGDAFSASSGLFVSAVGSSDGTSLSASSGLITSSDVSSDSDALSASSDLFVSAVSSSDGTTFSVSSACILPSASKCIMLLLPHFRYLMYRSGPSPHPG